MVALESGGLTDSRATGGERDGLAKEASTFPKVAWNTDPEVSEVAEMAFATSAGRYFAYLLLWIAVKMVIPRIPPRARQETLRVPAAPRRK